MKRYLALMPDEDGDCTRFLDSSELHEMLEEEYFGPVNFLSEEDLEKKGYNPQRWSYHKPYLDVLLIELSNDSIKVPKPVTSRWRLEP